MVSKRPQVAGITVILIVVVAASGYLLAPYILNPAGPETVTIHLLDTVGVIIEYNDTSIFIDPWYFLENYTGLFADVVLITHPHFDHYNETTMNSIQKEDTMNVLPASMTAEVDLHDGVGVVPGDVVQFGGITITAFYLYTAGFGHLRSNNWTSYLIDINGFTIFHAGDALNMTEYEELNGLIDVAFLPIYSLDNQTISDLERIQPRYFVPTHFYPGMNTYWFNAFEDQIIAASDCEIINMEYWTSHTFEL
jgi:L-ascorbate metabolism protein UlaG (beta-lactamase superfamily)